MFPFHAIAIADLVISIFEIVQIADMVPSIFCLFTVISPVMLNYAGEYCEYCDACQAAVTVIRSSDAALKS